MAAAASHIDGPQPTASLPQSHDMHCGTLELGIQPRAQEMECGAHDTECRALERGISLRDGVVQVRNDDARAPEVAPSLHELPFMLNRFIYHDTGS
jgi:hypothetical protein